VSLRHGGLLADLYEPLVEPRQHLLARVADEVLAEDGERDRLRQGGEAAVP